VVDDRDQITDFADLAAAVKYIKEGVDVMQKSLTVLGNDVNSLALEQAVLDEWRKNHRDTHKDLNTKVNRLGAVYTAVAAAAAFILSYLGGK
jgi:uncharacterized protein YoxC